MVSHTVQHEKSDWEAISPPLRTSWQRLAAHTHGFVTPGNLVTICGVLLSFVGIGFLYNERYGWGFILLVLGRFADIIDGFVADRTKTKSRVGEALDAGFDKVVAVAAIVVFLWKDVVPFVPLIILLVISMCNVGLGAVAKLRRRIIHPTQAGKYAALLQWLSLCFFVLAKAITSWSIFGADLCNFVGYGALVISLLPAIDSARGYAHDAFGRAKWRDASISSGLSGHFLRLWRGFVRRKWLLTIAILFTGLGFVSAYFLATSPYSSDTVVKSPFTTQYVDGKIVLTQHYTPKIYTGWWASFLGIYGKQMVSDVWFRITSPKISGDTAAAITANIHARRFDPTKPYVISGDQFDGLYMRNLGVFYQDLLNPHTTLSPEDWHNRQRLAVQSVAYSLAAIDQLKRPVTTLLPISAHGVLAVNFFHYPSDTLFGVMSMLNQLQVDPATHDVAIELQQQYGTGLRQAYQHYLATVRDQKTGMVRSNVHISSARDGVNRSSSFYDNVILWRTEQLATAFGLDTVSSDQSETLRQAIMQRYWDAQEGHFIDDVAPGREHSYSSDWLIALPTDFLHPTNAKDLEKITRISQFIDTKKLASPLPIRYTTATDKTAENFFVRTFVGSYVNTATWSYWGNLYISMQLALYKQTGQAQYIQKAQQSIDGWERVMVRDHGYPETLNDKGAMLVTPVYQSIRRNGWVVGLEAQKYQLQTMREERDHGSSEI